jgi:transglutaminase-like putative cysteine protease
MYVSITHLTRFTYSAPITDSMMEVRMQPLTDNCQRCLTFNLQTSPSARAIVQFDQYSNPVHFFGIPGSHQQLAVRAESLVEMHEHTPLPDGLSSDTWAALDGAKESLDLYDMLLPSEFAHTTTLLHQLESELGVTRTLDPLTALRFLNERLFGSFTYRQNVTKVDSPIDEALLSREGVCQDFSHVMITLVRGLGIPCRYVSGYLYRGQSDRDRSADDASHAWVEAWLPELGWVGFDPTNNLICADRHIRVAVGRDYADVPPSRGVFRGDADSSLEVAVKVTHSDAAPKEATPHAPEIEMPQYRLLSQQQQQQQQ